MLSLFSSLGCVMLIRKGNRESRSWHRQTRRNKMKEHIWSNYTLKTTRKELPSLESLVHPKLVENSKLNVVCMSSLFSRQWWWYLVVHYVHSRRSKSRFVSCARRGNVVLVIPMRLSHYTFFLAVFSVHVTCASQRGHTKIYVCLSDTKTIEIVIWKLLVSLWKTMQGT